MSEFINWITIIQGIVTIIVLPIGVVIAWNGLTTWKDQMNAKAEYDLARNILLSVYKARDAMDACRFRIDILNYIDQPTFIKMEKPKIDELSEARRQLDVELLEAKFIWDFKTVFPLQRLSMQAYELEFSFTVLYAPEAEESDRERYRPILFENSESDKDEFAMETSKIMADIENVLRPKLILKKVRTQK